MSRKMGRTIADVLQKCDMVILRDTLSLKRLRKFASLPNAIVAADSATILTSHSDEFLNCLSDEKKNALMSDCEKIGVCVSSQRALSDLNGFAETLDSLLAEILSKLTIHLHLFHRVISYRCKTMIYNLNRASVRNA